MSEKTLDIFELGESEKLAKIQKEVAETKKSNKFANAIFEKDVENEKQKIYDLFFNVYERAKKAMKELKAEHTAKKKSIKTVKQRVKGSSELVEVEELTPQLEQELTKLSDNHEKVLKAFDTACKTSTFADFEKLDNILKKLNK